MSAYDYAAYRAEDAATSKDWSLYDNKNFVVVFVNEQTYNSQKDWEIRIKVHKKSDPNATLDQRPAHILTKVDFEPQRNKPIEARTGEKIYWATREMTGEPALSVAQLEALTA